MTDFYTERQNHYLAQLAALMFSIPSDLPSGEEVPGNWKTEADFDVWIADQWDIQREAKRYTRRREVWVIMIVVIFLVINLCENNFLSSESKYFFYIFVSFIFLKLYLSKITLLVAYGSPEATENFWRKKRRTNPKCHHFFTIVDPRLQFTHANLKFGVYGLEQRAHRYFALANRH